MNINNQKGFANVVLVIVIILLVGTVGYFTFFKKPKSSSQQPTSVESQSDVQSKPFVKVREDEDSIYYEGHVIVSGTYSRGVDSFLFELDTDQERLFSSVQRPISKQAQDDRTRFAFEPGKEALTLIPQKTKLSFTPQKGAPCRVMGRATVIISSYIAPKILAYGNYNRGTLEKVLSSTEESFTYWEQRKDVKEEILDCTGVTP